MIQSNLMRRTIVALIVAGSAACLIARANPVAEPQETELGLSLAQADEAMTILKLYCGAIGFNVRYLGPSGTPGNLTAGRVWGPLNSTGYWMVSEDEEDGSDNWVRIEISPRTVNSQGTVLFLLDEELYISTDSIVDGSKVVDPEAFRFNNGRTWPEMLASLSEYSKNECELRRRESQIDWDERDKLVEPTKK